LPDPLAAEMVIAAGPDFVLIELDLAVVDLPAAVELVAVCRSRGVPALVRLPAGELALVAADAVLSAGAHGVVANSDEEPEALEVLCRSRTRRCGVQPAGSAARTAPRSGATHAEGGVAIIAEVEVEEPSRLDAALRNQGIDAVWINARQLSRVQGRREPTSGSHSEVDPLEELLSKCRAGGKAVGATCPTGVDAKELAQRGSSFVVVSDDRTALIRGLEMGLGRARLGSPSRDVPSALY
jgi:2-keto-3-deoxy-L-rhamnonate aldolase RhmA